MLLTLTKKVTTTYEKYSRVTTKTIARTHDNRISQIANHCQSPITANPLQRVKRVNECKTALHRAQERLKAKENSQARTAETILRRVQKWSQIILNILQASLKEMTRLQAPKWSLHLITISVNRRTVVPQVARDHRARVLGTLKQTESRLLKTQENYRCRR